MMPHTGSVRFHLGKHMNTIDYLKLAKAQLGITSDYALAARLGITRSTISGLSLGKGQMSDETCLKIAEILGMPGALVIAHIHAEREKNKHPEVAAAWRSMAEMFPSFDEIMRLLARGIFPMREDPAA